MIEVRIVGGSHDGEWVSIPDDAHSIRILKRRARPDASRGVFNVVLNDCRIEEFDLIHNEHFKGFAEAVLRNETIL